MFKVAIVVYSFMLYEAASGQRPGGNRSLAASNVELC